MNPDLEGSITIGAHHTADLRTAIQEGADSGPAIPVEDVLAELNARYAEPAQTATKTSRQLVHVMRNQSMKTLTFSTRIKPGRIIWIPPLAVKRLGVSKETEVDVRVTASGVLTLSKVLPLAEQRIRRLRARLLARWSRRAAARSNGNC